MAGEIDPIRYELYRHRLFHILEEGRIALKMVSGSPVVVEGGETMCSLHLADGTPILVAAGILLHAIGARDFIKVAIEWYEKEPGIDDGDQFFFNDPYIGGQHLGDMVVIKPIFYGGGVWLGVAASCIPRRRAGYSLEACQQTLQRFFMKGSGFWG